MDRIYTFYDYEEAYYHLRYKDCKTIGIYLLKHIKGDKAKKLIKRLENIGDYSWDTPQKELEKLTELLDETRIWIMVNYQF